MADSNVVALPGSDIPRADGEADPEVVRMLEERLEAVRRGELVAVAIAGVHRGRVRSDGFACASNHQNDLAAAIMGLSARYAHGLWFGRCDDEDGA